MACPVITIPIPGASAPLTSPAECPIGLTKRDKPLYLCDSAQIPGQHCKFDGEYSTVEVFENLSPCPQFNLTLPGDMTSLAAWRAFLEEFADQLQGAAHCRPLVKVGENKDWSAFIERCPTAPSDQALVDPEGPHEGDQVGLGGPDEHALVANFAPLVSGPAAASEHLLIFRSHFLDDDSLPGVLSAVKLPPANHFENLVFKFSRSWPQVVNSISHDYTVSGSMTVDGKFRLEAAYKTTAEGKSILSTKVAAFDGSTLVTGFRGSSMLNAYASNHALQPMEMKTAAPFANGAWRWVSNPTRINAIDDASYVTTVEGDVTFVEVSSPCISPEFQAPTVRYRIEEVGGSELVTEIALLNSAGVTCRTVELSGYTLFGPKTRRPSTMVETTYGANNQVVQRDTYEFLAGSATDEEFEMNWPKPEHAPQLYMLRVGSE